MNYLKLAKENEDLLIELRRFLHRHPEVSGKETQTVAFIKEKLKKFKIEFEEVVDGGVVAWLGNSTIDKKVLLRADIDALPMGENPCNLKGKKSAVSEIDGVCHACGHDAHTAMLLTAGKLLKENERELQGQVYLVFERGEEGTGNIKYILRYLEEKKLQFDAVYSTHVLSTFTGGKLSLEAGGVASGILGFDLKIKGRGGHGSRPDLSINPITCFNAFLSGLQSITSTAVSPFSNLTFSVGYVKAGEAPNIIPEELEFGGTVRFFHREDGQKFKEAFLLLLEHTTKAYHCTYEFTKPGEPGLSVNNHSQLSQFAKAVVKEHIGGEVLGKTDPWMASDSFSFFSSLWPSLYAYLGVQNAEKGMGAEHHNEHFDIDEEVLYLGVAAEIAFAVEFLKGDIEIEFAPFKGTPSQLIESLDKDDFRQW